MGFSTNFLSASERERIARELLSNVQPAAPGHRFTSACPFHSEKTPGGAFWYDPESDSAHCYSCDSHGDLIDIFCAVTGYDEGSSEGFRGFLKRFAPDSLGKGTRQRIHRTSVQRRWAPRRAESSPELWQKKAAEFVSACNKALFENADALTSLAQWGITPDTAAKVGLGWNLKRRFFPYSAWGLPYATNQNGREKHIYAPEGLVVPCYQRNEEGKRTLKRIKIRCSDTDEVNKTQRRYRALDGGEPCYGIWGLPHWKIWVVVETERDAVLLWQELHRFEIGAMGTGSATNAPDPYAHAILSVADCIVNALDNDNAGKGKSWKWDQDCRFSWSEYPHAVRWLVPSVIGKDVGDLPQAGINVWEWLREGLPAGILRDAERNARRPQSSFMDFPVGEKLEGLTDLERDIYADIQVHAHDYGLQFRFCGDTLNLEYAPGFLPRLDAVEFYEQVIRANPGILEALRGAACLK